MPAMKVDWNPDSSKRVLPALALLALASALFAFYIGENLADGARYDFLNFNYPSIQRFADLPFEQAVADYPAAGGPLFYLVFSPLASDPLHVRIGTFLLMLASAVMAGVAVARLAFADHGHSEARASAWIVATAMLLSPWVRSSGIWANNDIFSLFWLSAGLLLWSRRSEQDSLMPLAGAISCALFAALTRQLFLPFVLYFCAAGLLQPRSRGDRLLALAGLAVTAAAFAWLFKTWGGLTPPQYQRAHLALNWFGPFHAAAMAAVYLVPAMLAALRPQLVIRLAGVAAIIALFGLASGATYEGINGGFIFTKLGALLQSPLVFILLVAGIAGTWVLALDDSRDLLLRLLLFSLFFGQFLISRTLYQKYIDLPAYLMIAIIAPHALRLMFAHPVWRFAPIWLGLALMVTTTFYYR